MRAGYQQAAEMIITSNIWTQEGNKAPTALSHSPNDFKTWRAGSGRGTIVNVGKVNII